MSDPSDQSRPSPESMTDDARAISADIEVELAEQSENEEAEPLDPLLQLAVARRATDIHIDLMPDGHLVRFRIDGGVREMERLSPQTAKKLLLRIRVASNLGISRTFVPLEGQFSWVHQDQKKDIRVTIVPISSGGGESAHLRILTPPENLTDIDRLGMNEADLDKVRKTLAGPEGLVLVAGPTAAGKSTTLYSLGATFDLRAMIAASIEDPVEFDIPYIRQIEVDEPHDLSMYEGLRVLLRMDPDILLVGEIRDERSAITSVRAAEAARFVMATLHARDAAAAVEALHYLAVPYRILGGTLRLVIAQNLVRRLCEHCKQPRQLSDDELRLFEQAGLSAPSRLYGAGECDQCDQQGYQGRIGIFEVAPIQESLARRISQGTHQLELRQDLREQGVRSMIVDGMHKAALGITSLEEVMKLHWPGKETDATADEPEAGENLDL